MTNEHRLANIDTALYVLSRRQRRRPHRLHRATAPTDVAAAQLRQPARRAHAAVGDAVPQGAAGGACMPYLEELHYCCFCHVYLGPDNGDGICGGCDVEEEDNPETADSTTFYAKAAYWET